MKQILSLFVIFLISIAVIAQESYSINGETLQLKTEIDGKLDLLWTVDKQHYRYFIRTEDGKIQELLNTKGEDNHYQEEYKSLLNSITGNSAEKVNLTVPSLKEFIDSYNISADSSYQTQNERIKLATRLGGFVGMTNSPFIDNPENSIVPYFGAELEFFSENKLPRHAGFFSLRHQLASDDFDYSATQLAIGYRFRFLNKEKINIYGNLKAITYTFSSGTFIVEASDSPGTYYTVEDSGSTFKAPFIFGLGADIKLGKGYLTVIYQEIAALFLDLQGNFPVDFSVGYKFNL